MVLARQQQGERQGGRAGRRGATDVDTVLDVDARVRGLLQHPHLKGKVTFNDNDQGETRLMT